MEILNGWPGRLGLFLLAFPVVMLVIPFLVASLRQRLAWDKRQAVDAGTHSPCTRPPPTERPAASKPAAAGGREPRFLT